MWRGNGCKILQSCKDTESYEEFAASSRELKQGSPWQAEEWKSEGNMGVPPMTDSCWMCENARFLIENYID